MMPTPVSAPPVNEDVAALRAENDELRRRLAAVEDAVPRVMQKEPYAA